MTTVDFSQGVVVWDYRATAKHGWCGQVPEYSHPLPGTRCRSGLFVVRGVGLVDVVEERVDFGAAVPRSVTVVVVSSGFRCKAVACGSLMADPEDLIVLAARAAFRKCRRRKRRRPPLKAGEDA